MSVSMLTGVLSIVFGALYTFATFLMPLAPFGRPYEPKVFPYGLGVALFILGILLIIRETLNKKKSESDKIKFSFGNYEKKIVITIVCCVLYALLFDKIGYTFATCLFVSGEVLLFKGLKGWKSALLCGLLFSVTIFLLFNRVLGIYLPVSFLGWV